MDAENFSSIDTFRKQNGDDDDDDVSLPGFRFHPTDEELVWFYLRRKVEKKPLSIELIKHIDIYKYDPWDLPKGNSTVEKEWYFFCRRGRKYRNSVRPNRVTGSGFWKATGIDRPVYSDNHECIGLKKSLVYYRGSAGKGTKTEWMMHEFRLPPPDYHHKPSTKNININDEFQEAEVWTLCRILKRNTSHRKCMPYWRDQISTTKKNKPVLDASSKTCSVESDNYGQGYNINFTNTSITGQNENKAAMFFPDHVSELNQLARPVMSSISQAPSTVISLHPNFSSTEVDEFDFVQYADWDELRSIMEFDGGDHLSL